MKPVALLLWLAPVLAIQAQPKFSAVKENLGPLINDRHDQLLPVFSPERNTLFFSQNTGINEQYEAWQAPLVPGQGWGPKQKTVAVGTPSGLDQYVFGAYPGGWFLINGKFADKANPQSFGKGFSWYRDQGGPFAAQNTLSLDIDGLDEMLRGQFANAFYHPGRRVLLLSFATNGKRDLYVCLPKAGQTDRPQQWQRPVKLPSTVNSNFEDSCPFLDQGGTVLYFSSDRPGGFGQDDIYCSKLLSDDFGQWTPAQNLGFFVNSNQSELYYSVSPVDSLAYFVSYKNSYGAGDIFRIKFAMADNWPGQPLLAKPSPAADLPSPKPAPPANEPAQGLTVMASPVDPKIQLPLAEFKPNNLLLLLDVSLSMRQNDKMALLRRASDQLLSRLRPVDRVALVTFGERAVLRYATSALMGKDTLLAVMQRLEPNEGETIISPGLEKAYGHLQATYLAEGNNEIMVITDGYFNINHQAMGLIRRNPQVRLTFVLVDAGRIEREIVAYIQRSFPASAIVQMSRPDADVNRLLENVKKHSQKTP
jgi:hypothetical protein